MLFSSSKMLLNNKAREQQNVHNWKEHDCEASKFKRIFVWVLSCVQSASVLEAYRKHEEQHQDHSHLSLGSA